ncbi:MAG: hypothetical protein S4CHLAM7_08990 [Chlamydiae bacterium]|nr:hypothetical protein [Chlamydiota bacterium]
MGSKSVNPGSTPGGTYQIDYHNSHPIDSFTKAGWMQLSNTAAHLGGLPTLVIKNVLLEHPSKIMLLSTAYTIKKVGDYITGEKTLSNVVHSIVYAIAHGCLEIGQGLLSATAAVMTDFSNGAQDTFVTGISTPFQENHDARIGSAARTNINCLEDSRCRRVIFNQKDSNSVALPLAFFALSLGACAFAYHILNKANHASKDLLATKE